MADEERWMTAIGTKLGEHQYNIQQWMMERKAMYWTHVVKMEEDITSLVYLGLKVEAVFMKNYGIIGNSMKALKPKPLTMLSEKEVSNALNTFYHSKVEFFKQQIHSVIIKLC